MNRSRLVTASSLFFWLACGQGNQNQPPVCGNLLVEVGEQCDDGNNNDADGCEANCSLPRCQNNIVDPGENCLQESQLLLSETPVALHAGDLNNDGNQDLVTANARTREVSVFLGQGNSFFATPLRFPLPQEPTALALADRDGDLLLDINVTLDDSQRNTNFLTLSNTSVNGVLSFADADPVTIPGIKSPKRMIVADVNQDGSFELAILSQTSLALLDIDGNTLITQLSEAPAEFLLADLNADTFPELLVSFPGAKRLLVFPNINGAISPDVVNITTAETPGAIAGFDADGDGSQDTIGVALTDTNAVELFINTAGTLTALGGQGPVPVGLTPSTVQLLDLDLDGDPELVTTNLSSNDATVLFNEGGVFGLSERIALGSQPIASFLVDLNNDLVKELVVLTRGSDDLSILSRQNNTLRETARVATLGAPTLFAPVSARVVLVAHPASNDVTLINNNVQTRIATPIPADAIVVADFDQDALPDFVVMSEALGQVSVFLQATASFSAPLQVGTSPAALVVGDFNGDTFIDIVTANALSNDLTLLTNNADITALAFTPTTFSLVGVVLPTALAVGDMDGDADSDLVVSNGINGDVIVLLQSAGVFTVGGKKRAGASASAIGLADLTDDNKLDIVVTSLDNNDAQVIVNAGFAAGIVQFKEPVVFVVGLAPSFVSFGDFDLNGQQDALIANQESKDLALLRNNGLNDQGQPEFESQFFALDRVPFGAIILDQNNDGFSDFLVGIQEDRSLRLLLSAP
jgi:cysteine-rich repeat protein